MVIFFQIKRFNKGNNVVYLQKHQMLLLHYDNLKIEEAAKINLTFDDK